MKKKKEKNKPYEDQSKGIANSQFTPSSHIRTFHSSTFVVGKDQFYLGQNNTLQNLV